MAVPAMRMGWRDWLATFGNYLFNSLFFFAIALLALYLRPDLPAARALAVVDARHRPADGARHRLRGRLALRALLSARRGGRAGGARLAGAGLPRRAARRSRAAPHPRGALDGVPPARRRQHLALPPRARAGARAHLRGLPLDRRRCDRDAGEPRPRAAPRPRGAPARAGRRRLRRRARGVPVPLARRAGLLPPRLELLVHLDHLAPALLPRLDPLRDRALRPARRRALHPHRRWATRSRRRPCSSSTRRSPTPSTGWSRRAPRAARPARSRCCSASRSPSTRSAAGCSAASIACSTGPCSTPGACSRRRAPSSRRCPTRPPSCASPPSGCATRSSSSGSSSGGPAPSARTRRTARRSSSAARPSAGCWRAPSVRARPGARPSASSRAASPRSSPSRSATRAPLDALRQAQEALRRKERLALLGEFAGAVAHGVRNPLAGIRAAAQMAREQAADGSVGGDRSAA